MSNTNKKVINELQEYFLKQDPKIVARFLANMMIDLNRLYSIEELSENERKCLEFRMEHNIQQLRNFAKYGPTDGLTLTNIGPK